jgi:hypothetical protein
MKRKGSSLGVKVLDNLPNKTSSLIKKIYNLRELGLKRIIE